MKKRKLHMDILRILAVFFVIYNHTEEKGYYLFVGQLIDYKRADLALEACMKMNRRLLIVGEGNQLPALRKRAGKNICFRGRLEGEPLRRAYAEAEALLAVLVRLLFLLGELGLVLLEIGTLPG